MTSTLDLLYTPTAFEVRASGRRSAASHVLAAGARLRARPAAGAQRHERLVILKTRWDATRAGAAGGHTPRRRTSRDAAVSRRGRSRAGQRDSRWPRAQASPGAGSGPTGYRAAGSIFDGWSSATAGVCSCATNVAEPSSVLRRQSVPDSAGLRNLSPRKSCFGWRNGTIWSHVKQNAQYCPRDMSPWKPAACTHDPDLVHAGVQGLREAKQSAGAGGVGGCAARAARGAGRRRATRRRQAPRRCGAFTASGSCAEDAETGAAPRRAGAGGPTVAARCTGGLGAGSCPGAAWGRPAGACTPRMAHGAQWACSSPGAPAVAGAPRPPARGSARGRAEARRAAPGPRRHAAAGARGAPGAGRAPGAPGAAR
mmetsp:Transcript_19850/g.66780  ORF Transcript_19850/g.66780 Transcript_19850/m.66780 type:complete len:369 (-) Transcript_19850:1041-2147(-)